MENIWKTAFLKQNHFYKIMDKFGNTIETNIPLYTINSEIDGITLINTTFYNVKNFHLDNGYFIIVYEEISKDLLKHIISDEKTGAYSNEMFKLFIEKTMKRNKTNNVLCVFDIDDFKAINDTYGHQAGDEILIAITRIFKFNIKASDMICRFGGDEFVLLLSDINLNSAYNRIDEIMKKINSGIILHNKTVVYPTISLGMANYDNKLTYDENFFIADNALYESKKNGKNRVTISTKILKK